MILGRMAAQRSQSAVTFGRAVRELRGRVGISQEELGFRARVHRTYVGQVERGERNPTLMAIVKLAEGLAVEPADLVARAQQLGPLAD